MKNSLNFYFSQVLFIRQLTVDLEFAFEWKLWMVLILCHLANTFGVAKAFDIIDIIIGQAEAKNVKVVDDAILGHGFWNYDIADLDLVSDQNLAWRLVVLFGDCQELWFLQGESIFGCCPRTSW